MEPATVPHMATPMVPHMEPVTVPDMARAMVPPMESLLATDDLGLEGVDDEAEADVDELDGESLDEEGDPDAEGDEDAGPDADGAGAAAPPPPAPRRRPEPVRSSRAVELPGLFDPAGAPDADEEGEPAAWPVPLFMGEEVTGPFFRPAPDGSPMLEVHDMRRNGRRMERGAHLGRVPYDASEDDVAELGGPGPRWIAVRDVTGRYITGTSVLIERCSEPPPATPAPAAPVTSGLEAMLARMMAAQEKRAAALEARLVEMAQQRDAEELKLLRAQMRRGNAGGGGAPAVEDPLEVIERADRLKARFREALGVDDKKSEGGGGLLDELDDLLGDLGAGAEGLAKLAGSASKVAGSASKVADFAKVAGFAKGKKGG